jgi:hypothetical protein
MRCDVIILTVGVVLAGGAHAGSTRCWIDQGAVVVAATFGDIAGDFIIDLGAPASQLHTTRASEDGIEDTTATRPLVLAGRRLAAARLTVVDLNALPQTDTSIVGIIGADILARHPLTIAFAPCRLTWGASSSPRDSLTLPLALRGGVPAIAAVVSDGANTRRVVMTVSTGRTETLVPNATLSRAPKPGSTQPVRLRAVSVGGVLAEQAPAALAAAGPGSLGTGVWRRWSTLRIDWKRLRLHLGEKAS